MDELLTFDSILQKNTLFLSWYQKTNGWLWANMKWVINHPHVTCLSVWWYGRTFYPPPCKFICWAPYVLRELYPCIHIYKDLMIKTSITCQFCCYSIFKKRNCVLYAAVRIWSLYDECAAEWAQKKMRNEVQKIHYCSVLCIFFKQRMTGYFNSRAPYTEIWLNSTQRDAQRRGKEEHQKVTDNKLNRDTVVVRSLYAFIVGMKESLLWSF